MAQQLLTEGANWQSDVDAGGQWALLLRLLFPLPPVKPDAVPPFILKFMKTIFYSILFLEAIAHLSGYRPLLPVCFLLLTQQQQIYRSVCWGNIWPTQIGQIFELHFAYVRWYNSEVTTRAALEGPALKSETGI